MTNVAKNVLLIRRIADVPARQIGEWFGLTSGGYRHLEAGIVPYSDERLHLLSAKFRVPVEAFTDDAEAVKAIGLLTERIQKGEAVV